MTAPAPSPDRPDVPTAHTPPGGYGTVMPAPVLGAGFGDGPVEGAPDLRGLWTVVDVRDEHHPRSPRAPADYPVWHHVERIEQSGLRVVLTGSGVVHDLVADGTYEHGVRDVMASDFTTPAEMAARYEGGALVLRPRGLPAGESRRWRDGPDLRWDYHGFFVARLVRPAPPDG